MTIPGAGGSHIYPLLKDSNSSFPTFLKGLLHEIFVCFTWPIYTDLLFDNLAAKH
jgi:hypothetical protein